MVGASAFPPQHLRFVGNQKDQHRKQKHDAELRAIIIEEQAEYKEPENSYCPDITDRAELFTEEAKQKAEGRNRGNEPYVEVGFEECAASG